MGHRRTDEHRQTPPSCPPDHKLFDNGWDIRKRPDGTTEWIPQPQLPLTGGGINTYHHPERLLKEPTEPERRAR